LSQEGTPLYARDRARNFRAQIVNIGFTAITMKARFESAEIKSIFLSLKTLFKLNKKESKHRARG